MNEERDAEGFPIACEDNAGSLYRDEFGFVWVCVYEDHPEIADWAWKRVE